ncbi:hypothetical protein HQ563_09010 [bacterium]|nr:hypothetical protein [bacterium]
MPRCEIIDTFPAFIKFWEKARNEPLETQIELWLTDYMSQWPELLAKQQKNYAEQGVDWRAVAKKRVFPFLQERLPLKVEAREGLLSCLEPTYQRAQETVALDFDVVFVLYVGIGCGAGWATCFGGVPACLFGLENVAECGWSQQETLAALTAHELGHLLHQQRRSISGLTPDEGPFYQLYEEGFAKRCEHIIMGSNMWHEGHGQENWLEWCNENRAWLAAKFLTTVGQGKQAREFFGSWYSIRGRRQCGYFLGHEVIREWQREIDLRHIALLSWDEVRGRVRNSLERMAGHVI